MKESQGQREGSKVLAQESRDLLRRALEKPGVRDLMLVYEQWEKFNRAAEPCRQAMSAKRVVCASNSSGPAI